MSKQSLKLDLSIRKTILRKTQNQNIHPHLSLLPKIPLFFPPIYPPPALSSSPDFPLSLCNSPASVLLAIAAAFRVFKKLQHQFNNNTSPWNPSPYWPPSRAFPGNFYSGIKGNFNHYFQFWKMIYVPCHFHLILIVFLVIFLIIE